MFISEISGDTNFCLASFPMLLFLTINYINKIDHFTTCNNDRSNMRELEREVSLAHSNSTHDQPSLWNQHLLLLNKEYYFLRCLSFIQLTLLWPLMASEIIFGTYLTSKKGYKGRLKGHFRVTSVCILEKNIENMFLLLKL